MIAQHPGLLRAELDSALGPMPPLHLACLRGEEETAVALIEAEKARSDEEGGGGDSQGLRSAVARVLQVQGG